MCEDEGTWEHFLFSLPLNLMKFKTLKQLTCCGGEKEKNGRIGKCVHQTVQFIKYL